MDKDKEAAYEAAWDKAWRENIGLTDSIREEIDCFRVGFDAGWDARDGKTCGWTWTEGTEGMGYLDGGYRMECGFFIQASFGRCCPNCGGRITEKR